VCVSPELRYSKPDVYVQIETNMKRSKFSQTQIVSIFQGSELKHKVVDLWHKNRRDIFLVHLAGHTDIGRVNQHI